MSYTDRPRLSNLRQLCQAARPPATPTPPAAPTRQTSKERKRLAWMQQRAIFKLYALHNGKRSFDAALKILAKRWPVAVGMNPDFIERLRNLGT